MSKRGRLLRQSLLSVGPSCREDSHEFVDVVVAALPASDRFLTTHS